VSLQVEQAIADRRIVRTPSGRLMPN